MSFGIGNNFQIHMDSRIGCRPETKLATNMDMWIHHPDPLLLEKHLSYLTGETKTAKPFLHHLTSFLLPILPYRMRMTVALNHWLQSLQTRVPTRLESPYRYLLHLNLLTSSSPNCSPLQLSYSSNSFSQGLLYLKGSSTSLKGNSSIYHSSICIDNHKDLRNKGQLSARHVTQLKERPC